MTDRNLNEELHYTHYNDMDNGDNMYQLTIVH